MQASLRAVRGLPYLLLIFCGERNPTMARLTPEQLVQLKLMKETLAEMHGEINDMPMSEVYEVSTWLGYLWTKIKVVLVRNGVEEDVYRPTLSDDNVPF